MEITIKAPMDFYCIKKRWTAQYDLLGAGDARLIRIRSRSAIDVVVAKIAENTVLGPVENYYVSSPNFGVAIPGISSLLETHWIIEKLLQHEMSATDAITIAYVLQDLGDF